MDRKKIITDIKGNLQKISQILSLIESFESADAAVELDLLQKSTMQLVENYVKLKLSCEIPEIIIPEIKTAFVFPKENMLAPAKEVPQAPVAEPEIAKKSFGFNFNLGDDEGKINHSIESDPEASKSKFSEFNLNNAINEALNIAIAQTEKKVVPETPIINSEIEKDITLNERFSSMKKEENLANKHLNNPILDLAREISLNKKFAFVNELFAGSMDEYNLAIQRLNTIGSMDYANKYLNELRANLKWSKESIIVNDFTDLIERRWTK